MIAGGHEEEQIFRRVSYHHNGLPTLSGGVGFAEGDDYLID